MSKVELFLDRFVNLKDKDNPENLRKGRFFVASLLLLVSLGIPFTAYAMIFQSHMLFENLQALFLMLVLLLIIYLNYKFQIRIILVNLLTAVMFTTYIQTYNTAGGIFSTDNIWCVVYSCWVFLVASKRSGLFWFSFSLIFYAFLFYAEKMGLRDFRSDFDSISVELVFINFFFSAVFLGIIIFLHELGKEKYLNALLKAKNKIEQQSNHIISSIQYAKRIQQAVMPDDESVDEVLKDHFIYFKPRDIVSGDFYWVKKVEEYEYIVVADCTGHGVPGAFMSLLGISFLNDIISGESVLSPAEVLDKLRDKVKKSLKQVGKSGEAKDGMDLVMIRFNRKTNELLFAGAYNSLIHIRNGENEVISERIKGDRMPIGIGRKEVQFSNQEIKVEKGDLIYMYSDGFVDQMGGPKNQKFMTKHFVSFLKEISAHDLNVQKEKLSDKFNEWKGSYDQIDDVIVMGIRV